MTTTDKGNILILCGCLVNVAETTPDQKTGQQLESITEKIVAIVTKNLKAVPKKIKTNAV